MWTLLVFSRSPFKGGVVDFVRAWKNSRVQESFRDIKGHWGYEICLFWSVELLLSTWGRQWLVSLAVPHWWLSVLSRVDAHGCSPTAAFLLPALFHSSSPQCPDHSFPCSFPWEAPLGCPRRNCSVNLCIPPLHRSSGSTFLVVGCFLLQSWKSS